MPKIKIQIEADDDEFTLEDIENFLNDLNLARLFSICIL